MTFEGASTLEFEVRDAQGTSGVDYDLLVVESDLINIGTVADPMTISLHTLDLLDEAGQATNFDNSQDYTWTIATAVGSINGFFGWHLCLRRKCISERHRQRCIFTIHR